MYKSLLQGLKAVRSDSDSTIKNGQETGKRGSDHK